MKYLIWINNSPVNVIFFHCIKEYKPEPHLSSKRRMMIAVNEQLFMKDASLAAV